MTIGAPRVVRLKCARSSGRWTSSALSLPIAPLRATAAIRLMRGVVIDAIVAAARKSLTGRAR